MRKRFNVIAVAVVLAIGSFAFARYRYADRNTATLTNPFNKSESTQVSNPLMTHDLFGDWMKDEVVFAIIVPVALIAAGVVLAAKRRS
jgi:hypothetical protein